MKPTAKYKAGNIEADKNTGMQFQAIAAFNKVLGS